MSHKHRAANAARNRLVAQATQAQMPKLTMPPAALLDGLRVVLGPAGGLVALTTHGLEVPIELSLAGLNRLHEMLVEQQRKKVVPPLGVTPTYILAEWQRLPGEGNGKVHRAAGVAGRRPSAIKRAFALEDLL